MHPHNIITVTRYNSDGNIDNSFGILGRQVINFLPSVDYILNDDPHLAIQADGKILVASSNTSRYSGTGFYVARLNNEDGNFDDTFGNHGITFITSGIFRHYATAIAVQSDGKIIVGGGIETVGGDTPDVLRGMDLAIARLNENGSHDNTFGDPSPHGSHLKRGIVLTNLGVRVRDKASSIIMQENKILVLGSDNDFILVRYDAFGRLDNSFGTNGVVRTQFREDAFGSDFAILPSGEIVSVGRILLETGRCNSSEKNFVNYAFILAGYTSNGFLDKSFKGFSVNRVVEDGTEITNFSPGNDQARAIVFTRSKFMSNVYKNEFEIFVVGDYWDGEDGCNGKSGIVLARYKGP